MTEIPVFKPLIGDAEIQSVTDSLRRGWLGMGADVGKFETALASAIEADDRHVVALSTGHAALHLGLILAGVEPGDEVITPSFNNIADFQAILACGATPVFCDIDDRTLCLDVNKAAELITAKTKAIIAMDYDCCLADHEAVETLANANGLRVLHDAAHSLGSSYKGKKVGSFSDLCMFSFDPVKTITCIDGGALVVRTEKEKERLHELRLVGMTQPASVMYGNARAWTYDVNQLGFRYHMANLHGAIGLTQLSQLEEISFTRREACQFYSKHLAEIPSVRIPESDFKDVTPFLYYIRVSETERAELRSHLKSLGIDTGIHWQPGHTFSLFSKTPKGDLSVTDRVGNEILSLPLHSMMALETVKRVCDGIKSFYQK